VGLVGGAGFIGSHFVDHLLLEDETERVVVFDNFSSGRAWHLEQYRGDRRLEVVAGDVRDLTVLAAALAGVGTVIHLASNPDIARAATEPAVDFEQGTVLTHQVLEAMRLAGPRRIIYASGSGVYGDLGEFEVPEDHGPLIPVSTYGASKLAGEALISSYCAMFGFTGLAFRFANVVGPRQTHGVGFDFVRRLLADPSHLHILGDGRQSKSYIAVSDVVEAVLTAVRRVTAPFSVFNVATGDYITVRAIAELAVAIVGSGPSTTLSFTGGDRGWKGDVPTVRLDTRRIRNLGWTNRLTTDKAVRESLQSILADAKAGRFEEEVAS
jgi:UDP-glucose 4-epimerase